MNDHDDPRAERMVLGHPSYRVGAERLADRMGAPFGLIEVHRFPDGESRVRLPANLPAHVIVCLSLNDPNHKLVELELTAVTARTLGARHLTLVAPYLCYMRQDKAFVPGEAVSQRIVGRWLARHFDAVVTVDPHLHRTPRLADAVPVRRALSVSASPVLADWLRAHVHDPILIGPDEESRQWLAAIAAPRALAFGVARKQRLGDRSVRVELPTLCVRDRHVVLVDDVVSTGHTLAEAAAALRSRGAAGIEVLVTHALFVDDAMQRLTQAGVDHVCSTDSVPHPSNGIHLDGLLCAALDTL